MVKDADGKILAQVVDFDRYDFGRPRILLNIEGVPALMAVNPYGVNTTKTVLFDGDSCVGPVYILEDVADWGIEGMTHTQFAVVGPDPEEGTYRVFRAISPGQMQSIHPRTQWRDGTCRSTDLPYTYPAWVTEEVIPNPLEGFHGPTLANPERTWTIEGGDRIQ